MALKRIELCLNPGTQNERALIDSLDALGGEYGAKSRFLKERLLQGHIAIQHQIDGFIQDPDPMSAIDRAAATMDAKHYRVLKMLLIRKISEHGSMKTQIQQASAPTVIAPTGEVPTQLLKPDTPFEKPASTPPLKHDWSAFAGIAGAKKEG